MSGTPRLRRPTTGSRVLLGGVALIMVLLILVPSAAQAAKAGNSQNTKACQKDGWRTLMTSTGASFASQGKCTSYAARGGTLTPKPDVSQLWQKWGTTCVSNAGNLFYGGDAGGWYFVCYWQWPVGTTDPSPNDVTTFASICKPTGGDFSDDAPGVDEAGTIYRHASCRNIPPPA